jgi:hypothetical protein
MKTIFKIPQRMRREILVDLVTPHPFAYERVGFIACRATMPVQDTLLIFASEYESVPDEEYVEDASAAAVVGPDAIRRALRIAFNEGQQNISVFHVHHHFGRGVPMFSRIDIRETSSFVPDFFHTAPTMPHGALILSDQRACGRVWLAENARPILLTEIVAVGTPTEFLNL